MADPQVNKLGSLLNLIRSVDGPRIKSPLSDYNTIWDMNNKIETGNQLTSSQLNLVQEINKLYLRKNGKL